MKKLILLSIVSGFAITCFSQQDDFLDLQLQKRKKENNTFINPPLSNPALQKNTYSIQSVPFNSLNNLSHVLSNGDKVYLLPQDNMPCVVTDITRFSTASIYGKGENPLTDKIGSIPNIAIKPKAISR